MATTDAVAAPEWVRALQAALHADMAADDSILDRRARLEDDGRFRESLTAMNGTLNDEGNEHAREQHTVDNVHSDSDSSLPSNDSPAPAEAAESLQAPEGAAAVPSIEAQPTMPADTDVGERAVSQKQATSVVSSKGCSENGRPQDLKKATTGCYSRLIINTKNLDTARFSPKVAISVKDNLGRLFSRESGEVTLMKKKLGRYITALQSEITLVQKSITVHTQHMAESAINLKDQELQLKRWALGHLFRNFQLQAWLRHARCEFVVFIVKYILNSLQKKVDDAAIILRHVSNKKIEQADVVPSIPPPYDMATIDNYCLAPEAMLMAEARFVEMHTRLLLLDKLCHRSLHKFRTKLPDLESKQQQDRMDLLHSLLSRYSAHMKNSQPLVKENDHLTWDNFIIWSMKRQNEQAELEKEYFGLVEDERETEGRLFRRWCILMNPKFIENELNILTVPVDRSGASLSSSGPRNSFQGEAAFVNAELASLLAAASEHSARQSSISKHSEMNTAAAAQKPDMVLSPRTVIAFIRYFSRDVIGKLYKVPVLSDMEEALFTLTEQLVFRRIGSVILRYRRNRRTEKRDSAWRVKCSRCRLMDPVSSYGVAPEFLKNVENPGYSRGSSGDLLLRTSRKRSSSSSGKRRRRSDSGNRSNPSPTQTQRLTTPTSLVCDDPIDISAVSPEGNQNCRAVGTSSSIPENAEVTTNAVIKEARGAESPSEPLQFEDFEVEEMPNGPSFLKRVSAPLGEDLLNLLNTPAKGPPPPTGSETNRNGIVVKALFSPAGPSASTLAATRSIDSATQHSSESESIESTKEKIAFRAVATPLEQSKVFPVLKKSLSMESTASGKRDRSGSYIPTISIQCPGCDACRGRVCRPRLVSDLVAVAMPIRYTPTVYPATQSRPAGASPALSPLAAQTSYTTRRTSQFSGSGDGIHPVISGEKNKAVFWHENLKYAIPFRRTIRLLTQLSSCICPRDMLFTLTWSMKWLHSDALEATGKSEFLGADLMIPLLVMCLIHSKIPCIHLIMQFIRDYGGVDPCGESAYIMTCVEAAVAFIDRLEVSVELEEMASSAYAAFDQQLSAAGLQRNCSCTKLSSDVDCRADNYSQDRLVLTSSNGNLSGMVDDDGVLRVSAGFANQSEVKDIEEMAMEKLGEWLRDQKAMEDTIGILQQEGWMA